jgi:hypothetical protein
MKKILYICTKSQYDWSIVVPESNPPSSEIDPSVLLLQNGRALADLPPSQVFILESEGEEGEDSRPYEQISYQGFLEKIFGADLALVV